MQRWVAMTRPADAHGRPTPPRSRTRALAAWSWEVVRGSYERWRDDRVIRLGAGLAYYALLAIVPVLTVSVAIAGAIVQEQDLARWLGERLADVLGDVGEELGASISASLSRATTSTGLGLLGFGALLVSSSFVFVALQDAFKTIWHMPVQVGVKYTVLKRLTAFALVLGVAAFFVASLAIQTATGFLEALLPVQWELGDYVLELFGTTMSWALGIVVLYLLFRLLPGANVARWAAAASAVVTAVLLVIGTNLIGVYLREVASQSLVGAFGGVLLVLLWVYYEAQILLVGVVLTRQLTEQGRPRLAGPARSTP